MNAFIIFALLLGITSLMLSAIFSGTETAFYRSSKLRLKLDALAGDTVAKRLLWFANNPGFLIATLLVGNNVANYGASMAIVLLVGCMIHGAGIYAELIATLAFTPILFVYGEMFPKYLCLNAPNRMFRRFSPIVTIASWIFLPLTALFWGINRTIASILGQPNKTITLSLGRRELTSILVEGKDTGILSAVQRQLAEGIFNCSGRLVKDCVLPQFQLPAITITMKPQYVLDIARKFNLLAMPVYEPEAVLDNRDLPVGYVRVIDLEIAVRQQLDEQSRQLSRLLQTELPLCGTVELLAEHSLLTALILLQTKRSAFGCVMNKERHCIGFVSADQLWDLLIR